MPSDAVLVRLNAIVVLLAGILGALLIVVLADHGPGELVAAVAVGTAIAWLAVERVNDGTRRGSEPESPGSDGTTALRRGVCTSESLCPPTAKPAP